MAGPLILIADLLVAAVAAFALGYAWRKSYFDRGDACGRAALLLLAAGIGVAGLASFAHLSLSAGSAGERSLTPAAALLTAFELLALLLVAAGFLRQGRARKEIGRVLKRSADAVFQAEAEVAEVRTAAEALRDLSGEEGQDVVVRLRAQRRLDEVMGELAAARDRLEAENVYLQQEILSSHGFNEVIGESDSLRRCLNQVAQVAGTMTPVLIQGETGTGKELIARAIHQRSERRDRPLVQVNCAALPASLIESELFGHERGAFTGAVGSKRGRFDLADGGTLFLDEIADIAADLQAKLLRVLQEGEFQRVGGTKTISTDVRIIAATNRNLQDAVEGGQFRADLFYRINTFTIEVPALRERDGDIALLAQHFATKYAQQLGKRMDSISQAMLDQLEAHDWPGNVRELEGVIQRSLITAEGPELQLARPLRRRAPARDSAGEANHLQDLRSAEIAHIRDVLDRCDWKIAGRNGAAARLGLPESTLRSRMKKFGIERPAPVA